MHHILQGSRSAKLRATSLGCEAPKEGSKVVWGTAEFPMLRFIMIIVHAREALFLLYASKFAVAFC